MIGYIIISLISLLIIIGIYKWLSGRALDKIQRYKESEFYLEREKYKRELDRQFEEERKNYINELLNIKKEIEQTKQFNSTLLSMKEREIDNIIEEKRKAKEAELDRDIEDWAMSAQEAATWERDQVIKQYEVDKEKSKEELQKILSDIEDYRKKRDAINQEILREKELKLKKDIHRIIISEEDKNDITFLISILPKINHKETVYKLIWSEYLIKPFQDMIKNSFGGKVPKNVIYCIESTDGKLKYIGKTSADVSKRWTEHIKTSLNIGGVSRSKLHDALYLHWDEFLFSVIEETTKEQLSEKEKYYINFFESDKYGLNIKSGG